MVGVLEGIVYETYRVGVLTSASCHNRGQGVVRPVTKRLLSCLSPNGLHLRVQLVHGVHVQVDSRLLPQFRQAGQLPLLIGGVAGGHLSLRSHSLLRDDSLRRRGTSPRLSADIGGNLRRFGKFRLRFRRRSERGIGGQGGIGQPLLPSLILGGLPVLLRVVPDLLCQVSDSSH